LRRYSVPEGLNETRVVLIEEFKRFVRGKVYIIITLAVPVVLLLILALIPMIRALSQGDGDEVKPSGVVVLSVDLGLGTDDLPGFTTYGNRDQGKTALIDGIVNEVFVVPEDYMETGQVEWLHGAGGVFSGFDPGPSDASASVVRAYLRTAVALDEVSPDVLNRAVAGTGFTEVRIGEDGLPIEEDSESELGTAIVSLAAAFLLMFSILIGASSLGEAVAEEKENRMIEILVTSIKPMGLLAGKVLAIGAGQLIMITVWAGSLVLLVPRIFDVVPDAPQIPVNFGILLWILAFFLAGYFVSAVIMAGIGAMATKVREANQLAFAVVMPTVVPIWTMTTLLGAPDGTLARILSFIPFTAPSTMMIRLGAGGSSILESLLSLAVVALTGLILLWASARVFRAGLLMYGQRMSIRGVVKALKEAG
jgi:ABC-2 type transport system permease protein